MRKSPRFRVLHLADGAAIIADSPAVKTLIRLFDELEDKDAFERALLHALREPSSLNAILDRPPGPPRSQHHAAVPAGVVTSARPA